MGCVLSGGDLIISEKEIKIVVAAGSLSAATGVIIVDGYFGFPFLLGMCYAVGLIAVPFVLIVLVLVWMIQTHRRERKTEFDQRVNAMFERLRLREQARNKRGPVRPHGRPYEILSEEEEQLRLELKEEIGTNKRST